MKLAHLKAEARKEGESLAHEESEYPSGHRIHIHESHLKHFGMNELPEHGDKFRIEAKGHVHRVHDGPEGRSVEFQITHGGGEPEKKAEEVPEKSLRGELEEARKNSKPIQTREDRAARLQKRGKDAGEHKDNPQEPAHGKAVGA